MLQTLLDFASITLIILVLITGLIRYLGITKKEIFDTVRLFAQPKENVLTEKEVEQACFPAGQARLSHYSGA